MHYYFLFLWLQIEKYFCTIRWQQTVICNEYKMKNSEFNVGNSLENKIARDMVDKGYYNSLVYKYSKVSEWEKLYKNSDKTKELNVEIDQWERYKQEMELCKILVKDHVAKVSVIFDRNKYVRTVTSLKATFNDKLANFGKRKISYHLIIIKLF